MPPKGVVLEILSAWGRGVALQVAFERQTLKPVFILDRFTVMGLNGYRLWPMGLLDSTCRAPPRLSSHVAVRHNDSAPVLVHRGVAPQVVYLKGKL
jgi:hypothetical protein